MSQDLVLKAIRELGGRATTKQIKQYLREHYPGSLTATNNTEKPMRRLRLAGLIKRNPDGTYEIGQPERVILNFERELIAK